MPFKSKAQNAWAHTAAGTKALGGAAKVKEWEGATDYKSLPKRVPAHAAGGSVSKFGSKPQDAAYAHGGAVLERSEDWKKTIPNRGFLNTPDRFTSNRKPLNYPSEATTAEKWEKSGGPQGDLKPHDKAETPPKIRS